MSCRNVNVILAFRLLLSDNLLTLLIYRHVLVALLTILGRSFVLKLIGFKASTLSAVVETFKPIRQFDNSN